MCVTLDNITVTTEGENSINEAEFVGSECGYAPLSYTGQSHSLNSAVEPEPLSLKAVDGGEQLKRDKQLSPDMSVEPSSPRVSCGEIFMSAGSTDLGITIFSFIIYIVTQRLFLDVFKMFCTCDTLLLLKHFYCMLNIFYINLLFIFTHHFTSFRHCLINNIEDKKRIINDFKEHYTGGIIW
ncbi:hypothetical protein POVWA2_038920 [Plasmodium ovale wallikeri]|uniref:Uncharacterized protein n=1 Tax=Plasmodium ovale wallikeri TaxID=864142 RepID=A0A1A8Z845_PLAOA|nr:hypothetical protein POVWA1_040150 [Plasmodium ovale wallikeri]SBT40005.1 hypothetical protein POVWA2_038920 [Plasmodium ovale wallikeri]